MKNKRLVIGLLIMLLSAASYADCDGGSCSSAKAPELLTVEKSAKERIVLGDVLEVAIRITNNYSVSKLVFIREEFGSAQKIDTGVLKGNASIVPTGPAYYSATINVSPNSVKEVVYKIKPLYYGEHVIFPTIAQAEGVKISSNKIAVFVDCNGDGFCDQKIGENAFTCKTDCPKEKPDELCDKRRDKVCDPDCESNEDPDCAVSETTTSTLTAVALKKSICMNGVCDAGENYITCSIDCPSGGKDGVCDQVREGTCDPDCVNREDPDCSGDTTGSIIIILLIIITILIIVYISYKKRWFQKE